MRLLRRVRIIRLRRRNAVTPREAILLSPRQQREYLHHHTYLRDRHFTVYPSGGRFPFPESYGNSYHTMEALLQAWEIVP